MSKNFQRRLATVAGQQTYMVPGSYDYVPGSVTVNGSAATFTTDQDVDSGQRRITISSPTISVSGQDIVVSYAQTETTLGAPMQVTLGNGVDLVVSNSAATALVLASGAVDGYQSLTLVVSAAQVGLASVVEVTNDVTGTNGWTALRGTNDATGAIASSIAATGAFSFPIGGFKLWRWRRSAATSGTTTAYLRVSTEDTIPEVVVQGSVSVTGNVAVTAAPQSAAGGYAQPSRLASAAASTNATLVKASAGRLYGIDLFNASASVKYLKLFNKATAPVPGTDTPFMTIALPVGKLPPLDMNVIGISFNTGIGYAITGGAADLDATAVAAGDITALNLIYA